MSKTGGNAVSVTTIHKDLKKKRKENVGSQAFKNEAKLEKESEEEKY